MRESIENLKNSRSLFGRFAYYGIRAFGSLLNSRRREAIRCWFYRVTKIRPSYCHRVKEWGLCKMSRSPRVIVSLTSYPKRIQSVHRVVEQLLCQDFKPDKVVLWLGEDKFPNKEADLPRSLLRLRDFGLTIGWTRDIRSYTKLIPSLKEYPDDIVVTGDDDMFYPPDWLGKLYRSYELDNQSVHCHYVNEIKLDNGEVRPYREWSYGRRFGTRSFRYLLMGVGGVLYPPHSLHEDVLRDEKFLTLAPYADDLWFWAMVVLNGRSIKLVEGGNYHPHSDYTANNECALMNTNCGDEQKNDMQLAAIFREYPAVKDRLLSNA